jgi:hypothetical protein
VDILPLYVLLMLPFPLMLWLLLRSPTTAMLVSFAVYFIARMADVNFQLYPVGRQWYFNPFAWQLLFMIGAWCAVGGAQWLGRLYRSNVVTAICAAYLLFALWLSTTWLFPAVSNQLPDWLLVFPLDKTGLSLLRLTHFLAMAILVVRFVPPDARFLRAPWAKPLLLCGQHSLEVFCLGVFLSFTAYFVLVEVSARLYMQVLVSIGGVALMIALATLMTWYNQLDRRTRQPAA